MSSQERLSKIDGIESTAASITRLSLSNSSWMIHTKIFKLYSWVTHRLNFKDQYRTVLRDHYHKELFYDERTDD